MKVEEKGVATDVRSRLARLAVLLVSCRGVGPSGVAYPVPTLDGCVLLGTPMTVRLDGLLDTEGVRPGDAVTAKVVAPVLDASGQVAIPIDAAVLGRVLNVEHGQFGLVVMSFDRVQTTWGWSGISGRVSESRIEHPSANEGRAPVASTMTFLLGQPEPARGSIVCARYALVPAGTSFHVRLDDQIDSSVARPGSSVEAVALETLRDDHGRLLTRPAAALRLEVTNVTAGPPPNVRVVPRSVETLLGTAAISATARSGFEPYATVEPMTSGDHGSGYFRIWPAGQGSSSETVRPAPRTNETELPIAPIRVPAGAELLITLVEPLRLALPTR